MRYQTRFYSTCLHSIPPHASCRLGSQSQLRPPKLRLLRYHWDLYLNARQKHQTTKYYADLPHLYLDRFGYTMFSEPWAGVPMEPEDTEDMSDEAREARRHLVHRIQSVRDFIFFFTPVSPVPQVMQNWYSSSDGIWMPSTVRDIHSIHAPTIILAFCTFAREHFGAYWIFRH
jgi:hypothetical protein